jgi:hypothetical protein
MPKIVIVLLHIANFVKEKRLLNKVFCVLGIQVSCKAGCTKQGEGRLVLNQNISE